MGRGGESEVGGDGECGRVRARGKAAAEENEGEGESEDESVEEEGEWGGRRFRRWKEAG